MNGLINRNRTLGELMAELRSRLGFMIQGPAAKNNDAIMKSFLQEGQDFIYSELDPPDLRKKSKIRLSAGSYLYDWHDDQDDEDIDPSKVISVWIIASDTLRYKLNQGITEQDRSFANMRQQPQKYDHLNGQIELWPIPDGAYDLLIEYISGLNRFDRAADRSSVPDRLVFLYALAAAKSHYRHPDAREATTAFTVMLNKVKNTQKENRRYFQNTSEESQSPYVVRSNNAYVLGV